MVETSKIIGVLLIILFTEVSCKSEDSLHDSIWIFSDIDSNQYQELILINEVSCLKIFPITLDGIKPSKKLVLDQYNKYKIVGDNNYKFEIDNDLIRIIGQNEIIPFKKYRNFNESEENFDLVVDSFLIRRNQLLGDSIDYNRTTINFNPN